MGEGLSVRAAAREGDRERVAWLLTRGADISERDERGLTALHEAAERGDTAMVDFLLQHGAPVDVVDHAGFTPLQLALGAEHLEVVWRLFSAGAAPTLEAAVVVGDVRSLQALLAAGADMDARGAGGYAGLHWAAAINGYLAAGILLKHGADPNLPTEWDRESPLHIAARNGNADVGRLLIDGGANVDAIDTGGHTPLDLALSRKHDRMAHLLRAHGGQ